MSDFGVSFSLKYAREMGIDPQACLKLALKDLGVKRLRLMSYWDIHEPQSGRYDFTDLDWQFKLAKNYGARVSLALGLRQPRWPESHWPDWVDQTNTTTWVPQLSRFINAVVNRYKDHPSLSSWQLENEALLKTFGQNGNFDRIRLIDEYKLVKQLDPRNPVIMTTSDSWGLPIRKPRPDIYGISLYRRFYDRGKYRRSHRPAFFYKMRAAFIQASTSKPVFIHELQAEPWGPKATVDMSLTDQQKTMTADYFVQTIRFAVSTGLSPTYLWGLEWWYWLLIKHHDESLWRAAKKVFYQKKFFT